MNPFESIDRVIRALCADLGTARSLEVLQLYKAREWKKLLSLRVNPADYSDSESYFKDAFITDLLRKVEVEIPGLDLGAEAVDLFFEIEKVNESTNNRLSHYLSKQGPFEDHDDLRILDFLSEVRKEVGDILGAIPERLEVGFGPGATFRDQGVYTTVPDKITSIPTATFDALCLLPFWWESAWGRCVAAEQLVSQPEVVRGNRFTSVPKDGLKRRGICIEPSLNIGFQLDVGKTLKRRLLKVGIDLTHGKQVQMSMAKRGSRDGDLATIDLSNASDTVSYNCVKLLLPSRWFDVLDNLRSPMTQVNGKWVRLSKFSSMGNGFTFELETLIFTAVVRALARSREIELKPGMNFGVLGDDIICPVSLFQDVVGALKFLGFTPNLKKTFGEGRFRESCGGDYFDGVSVRPHYVKTIPTDPCDLISLHNGLKRASTQDSSYSDVRRLWVGRARAICVGLLPAAVRSCRGPDSMGDLVINDEAGWTTRVTADDRMFIKVVKPMTSSLSWHHWKPSVVFACALYGLDSSGVTPRGEPKGYKYRWVSCLERPQVEV